MFNSTNTQKRLPKTNLRQQKSSFFQCLIDNAIYKNKIMDIIEEFYIFKAL